MASLADDCVDARGKVAHPAECPHSFQCALDFVEPRARPGQAQVLDERASEHVELLCQQDACLAQLVQAEAVDGLATQPHGSGSGRMHTCDELDEGGLPGSTRPYDSQPLARLDGQVDAVKGLVVVLEGEPWAPPVV